MKTITKKSIVIKISRSLGKHPNDVGSVVQELLDQVTEHLSNGNRFEFRDFGVFEVVTRKAKVGRNPKAPKLDVPIPARKAVKFTMGKRLKELVGE